MVHHGKGIGGAPKSMSYLAKALVDDGVEVEVLFLQKSDAQLLFEKINCKKTVVGYPIYYLYHMSKWVRIWQFHKMAAQFLSFLFQAFWVAPLCIIRSKSDVVYINSSVLPEWVFVAKILKKKTFVHIRESLSDGHFGIRRRIISYIIKKFSDKIVFISKHNMKRMMLTESRDVRVVYNYEPGLVLHSGFEKIYDFIYVGGESPIKGFQMIQFLLNEPLEFKIVLAGSYSDQFKRSIGNDSRVTFVGVTNNIMRYIAESKFLISPFKEPHFSRPIIEAYVCGTVPIASGLEGIEEQVKDKTGLVFMKDDMDDFLGVIKRCLIMTDNEYNFLVDEGKKLYEMSFSQKNEKEILRMIKSVFISEI